MVPRDIRICLKRAWGWLAVSLPETQSASPVGTNRESAEGRKPDEDAAEVVSARPASSLRQAVGTRWPGPASGWRVR
jgi:hypothetical protein